MLNVPVEKLQIVVRGIFHNAPVALPANTFLITIVFLALLENINLILLRHLVLTVLVASIQVQVLFHALLVLVVKSLVQTLPLVQIVHPVSIIALKVVALVLFVKPVHMH